MMFVKARIIALVIGAGLVGTVSFANPQIALVNQKLEAFKKASLGKQVQQGGEKRQVGGVLEQVETNQRDVTVGFLKNALSNNPDAVALKKRFADLLNDAIIQRDAAGQALADAITECPSEEILNPMNHL
jgi:hypothetical protein